MKYCFLMAREWPDPTASCIYSFVPYKHGPFSFTLYRELDTLVRDDRLSAHGNNDIVGKAGKESPLLSSGSRQRVLSLMNRFAGETTAHLLDFVYAHYPWFTLNSESVERRKAYLPQSPCQVYTAGYEGVQVDAFLNRLLKNGIQRIIDVRANPISRKYGFHKSTLSRIAGSLNIEYRHVPELGIPSAWRTHLDHPDDFPGLFDRYNKEILPTQEAAIASVGASIRERPSVLICQEADPVFCHRSHLAAHLSTVTSMPIRDIGRMDDE